MAIAFAGMDRLGAKLLHGEFVMEGRHFSAFCRILFYSLGGAKTNGLVSLGIELIIFSLFL